MSANKVSVVIHTFNEEKNIKNCLETLKWANEIVIVDMYSDDKTVDIAKNYTDKIFFFERKGYADPARYFSLEKATHEWILSIDADELVPIKLKNKLIEIMENNLADVVRVPHNNYFFGYLMENTGWGALQDTHLRFFKKGFINFTDRIHGFTEVSEDARIFEIKDPEEGFIHFNYLDLEHFVEKMNKYTTIEAKALYQSGSNFKFRTLLDQMYHEFKRRFFNQNGRKEGFRGFSLSFLMATYRLLTYSKLKIMQKYNSPDPRNKIRENYQEIANEIIEEYKD